MDDLNGFRDIASNEAFSLEGLLSLCQFCPTKFNLMLLVVESVVGWNYFDGEASGSDNLVGRLMAMEGLGRIADW